MQIQIAQAFADHARLLSRDRPAECVGMFDGTSSSYIALLPKEVVDQTNELSRRES